MISTNELKTAGYLVSKVVRLGKNKETKKEWIMCDLTLQINETQRVTLSMFSNKLNSQGNESPIYKNMLTIKNEFKSLDSQFVDKRINSEAKPTLDESTTVASLEECDFLYANKGIQISMNHFMKDGELQSNFRLSTRFINRAKPSDPKESYLEGNLVGRVSKQGVIKEENGKDYIEVELAVPEYREAYGDKEESVSIDKFTLVLKDADEDSMNYCMDIFELNKVVQLGIEPITMVVTEKPKEKKEGRGFGKTVTFEPSTKTVREIRIIGGYDLDEAEYENEKAFDSDLFMKAVEDYNQKMEEIMSEKGKDITTSKGFGKKGSGTGVPF